LRSALAGTLSTALVISKSALDRSLTLFLRELFRKKIKKYVDLYSASSRKRRKRFLVLHCCKHMRLSCALNHLLTYLLTLSEHISVVAAVLSDIADGSDMNFYRASAHRRAILI